MREDAKTFLGARNNVAVDTLGDAGAFFAQHANVV
jgi:hypothetical protein